MSASWQRWKAKINFMRDDKQITNHGCLVITRQRSEPVLDFYK
jgi:hypothetical protein